MTVTPTSGTTTASPAPIIEADLTDLTDLTDIAEAQLADAELADAQLADARLAVEMDRAGTVAADAALATAPASTPCDGTRAHLRPVRLPGVYPAQRDTWLLADVLAEELAAADTSQRRVLELGAGAGALSTVAAGFAGADVTAVDVSRRALATTWLNARLRGRRVRLLRGDLAAPVAGQRFDVVVSNPPYVPAATDDLPGTGPARAWDGGLDGRTLLDRICADAPSLLAPGGRLLLVHSGLNGVARTLDDLAAAGLEVDVAARCHHPFGPVLTERAVMFEQRGLVAVGERTEELVVVRARRPR